MATIQFEDGTKVKFDGTPTPKDVEEVAQKLKLSKAPASTPAPTSTPTSLVSKAKSAVGGAAEGLGAGLPLMGIDYIGRKIVDKVGTPQMKQNLANAPSLTSQFQKTFEKDKNPLSYGAGEVAGFAGGLATGVSELKTAIKGVPVVAEKLAARDASQISKLSGEIVQGEKSDLGIAPQALAGIKAKGIKTYDDLGSALDQRITQGSQLLDGLLNTSSQTKKLADLGLKTKIGTQTVSHNYTDDAINQLREFYTKTNDIENLTKVTQLRNKAETVGLSIKELNDLAKLHGRDLNAFNANGQLASGLSKQAAENTRTGLKSTARDLFGDKIYKNTDEQLSKLIRTRKLVADMSEKVLDLQQKIQTRGFGEKAGRLVGQVINLVGMNGPKGLIEYFLGRGTGLKTMNALDMEKRLQGNLQKLEKLLQSNPTEADFIKQLESMVPKGK